VNHPSNENLHFHRNTYLSFLLTVATIHSLFYNVGQKLHLRSPINHQIVKKSARLCKTPHVSQVENQNPINLFKHTEREKLEPQTTRLLTACNAGAEKFIAAHKFAHKKSLMLMQFRLECVWARMSAAT